MEPQPTPAWPPLGLPQDACVFPLASNSKRPPHGFMGAHHKAVPVSQALLVPGPGASYGIRLDAQFLLADCDKMDAPEAKDALLSLPHTWVQRTKRGPHLLYRVPPGFQGKNCDWAHNGVKIGELKVNGYLVGPGSTVNGFVYQLVDDRDPELAPAQFLSACEQAAKPEVKSPTKTSIALGERDNTLTSFAGFYRRQGFGREPIAALLRAVAQSGILEQPPGNEYLEKDFQRIARSAEKWETEIATGPLTPTSWVSGEEIAIVGPPMRWLIRHFIPKGELVMVYGEGGCGKSSWASWLAATITQNGQRFGFVGVEEPFSRFLLRACIGGADRSLIKAIPQASKIVFPRDVDKLEAAIGISKLDCLFFDSIYTHFPSDDKSNMAERTRRTLGSLAEVSQRSGCTIVGIFHENRQGEYLGSTEMRNVGRYLLRARREPQEMRMTLSVDKTNFHDPGIMATFIAEEVIAADPDTGQVQYEEIEDGSLVPYMIKVQRRGEDMEKVVPAEKKPKTVKVKGSIPLAGLEDAVVLFED